MLSVAVVQTFNLKLWKRGAGVHYQDNGNGKANLLNDLAAV